MGTPPGWLLWGVVIVTAITVLTTGLSIAGYSVWPKPPGSDYLDMTNSAVYDNSSTEERASILRTIGLAEPQISELSLQKFGNLPHDVQDRIRRN